MCSDYIWPWDFICVRVDILTGWRRWKRKAKRSTKSLGIILQGPEPRSNLRSLAQADDVGRLTDHHHLRLLIVGLIPFFLGRLLDEFVLQCTIASSSWYLTVGLIWILFYWLPVSCAVCVNNLQHVDRHLKTLTFIISVGAGSSSQRLASESVHAADVFAKYVRAGDK